MLAPQVIVAAVDFKTRGSSLMEAVLVILAQVVGGTLAAVGASFISVAASVPDASELGAPAALEVLFSAVLGLLYLSLGTRRSKTMAALGYFACLASFSSSFNPALHLGTVLAATLGFGGGAAAVAPTSALAPLVGGRANHTAPKPQCTEC